MRYLSTLFVSYSLYSLSICLTKPFFWRQSRVLGYLFNCYFVLCYNCVPDGTCAFFHSLLGFHGRPHINQERAEWCMTMPTNNEPLIDRVDTDDGVHYYAGPVVDSKGNDDGVQQPWTSFLHKRHWILRFESGNGTDANSIMLLLFFCFGYYCNQKM